MPDHRMRYFPALLIGFLRRITDGFNKFFVFVVAHFVADSGEQLSLAMKGILCIENRPRHRGRATAKNPERVEHECFVDGGILDKPTD